MSSGTIDETLTCSYGLKWTGSKTLTIRFIGVSQIIGGLDADGNRISPIVAEGNIEFESVDANARLSLIADEGCSDTPSLDIGQVIRCGKGVDVDLSKVTAYNGTTPILPESVAESSKVLLSPPPHKHCVCGSILPDGIPSSSSGCSHENAGLVTFSTALTNSDFATQIVNGGNFYLAEDVSFSRSINIEDGQKITLCLNGHDVVYTGNGTGIYLTDGSLTICDCKSAPNSGVQRKIKYDETTKTWIEAADGTVTLTGGCVKTGIGSYWLKIVETCELNLWGGNIFNAKGYGVSLAAGTINMYENATICGSLGSGVAVESINSHKNITLNIKGGKIIANTTSIKGAGVQAIGEKATVNMTNGTISDNTVTGTSVCGGGVSVSSGAKFNLQGGSISKNTASMGGGVHINNDGVFNMSGGYIQNNEADSGGGVYIGSGGVFNMSGGYIQNNEANSGGGVYIGSGVFNMSGGTISGNKAKTAAGGVYVSGAPLHVSGSVNISGNKLTDNSDSNAYVYGNFPIIVDSSLTSGSKIYVDVRLDTCAAAKKGDGLTDLSAEIDKFFPDDKTLVLGFSDNTKTIIKLFPHQHDWHYTKNGNTITATCTATATPCDYQSENNAVTVTLNASACAKTYNGAACTAATVTKSANYTASKLVYTLKYVGVGDTVYNSTAQPVAAGTYKATLTLGNQTVEEEFTIAKATPTVTVPAAKPLTYNGNAQYLVMAGMTTGGTIKYRKNTNDPWSASVPQAATAGDYTVYWMVEGDQNYNDQSGDSVAVKIGRKEVSVTGITASPNIYDGTTSAALIISSVQLQFSGLVPGDQLSVTATGTFGDANVGTNKTVTISNLTLTGAGSDNYKLAASSQKTTSASITQVLKTNNDVPAPAVSQPLTYGDELSAAALPAGWVWADGDTVPTVTNNGFIAYYAIADDVNYSWSSVTGYDAANHRLARTVTVTVNKAQRNLVIPALDKTFDFRRVEHPECDYAGSGDSAIEYLYKVAGADDTTYTDAWRVHAGTYTVKVTVAESDNYLSATATKDFTISPMDIKDATITLADGTLVYTGSEQTKGIVSVTVHVGTEDLPITEEDGCYVIADNSNKGTNATGYTLKITGVGNFTGEKTITWTIAKQQVSKPVADTTVFTYNGNDQTYTLAKDARYTVTGDTAKNAGDYTATVALNDAANCEWLEDSTTDDLTFTWHIAPKDITNATVTLDKTVLTENGQAQTQRITSATVDGLTVTYDVEGNTKTEAGTYTLTVTGNGNFTGKVTEKYVILPKIDDKLEEKPNEEGKSIVVIGDGEINVDLKDDDKIDSELVSPKSHLIASTLDGEELTKIANGEDVEIWVEVKDAVNVITKESKQQIEAALKHIDPGYRIGAFLDVSMFKKFASDAEKESIHNTKNKIKVSVVVPEGLEKNARSYYIIRNHEGIVEVLYGEYDQDAHTFTFETDRFSDYAIGYKDHCAVCHDRAPFLGLCWLSWVAILSIVSVGGFATYWFAIKKRKFADFATVFKKK